MDQRLPNILSLMNQDKLMGAQIENSIQEFNASGGLGEYDETELLSKMFTKDHISSK
jgi:hypothetical protein